MRDTSRFTLTAAAGEICEREERVFEAHKVMYDALTARAVRPALDPVHVREWDHLLQLTPRKGEPNTGPYRKGLL